MVLGRPATDLSEARRSGGSRRCERSVVDRRFFVLRPWRGKGVTRRLVDAAAEYAAAAGAGILEAYPPDADSPTYRFMGAKRMFADAGFVSVGRAGSRRNVMRRELTGRRSY